MKLMGKSDRTLVDSPIAPRRWGVLILLMVAVFASQAAAKPRHGTSLEAVVKYPPGFAHYDYAQPGARKGGELVLSRAFGFDKLNPFSLKGRAAPLISLVFDSLADHALDEPFSQYGLLAESIDLAKDDLSVTFTLRSNARFSDGKPVRAEDVVFTFNTLLSQAATPLYRFYYRDVARVKAINQRKVRFEFSRKNRELGLILSEMSVLPRHFYQGQDFSRSFDTQVLGSGPYRVKAYEFGKYIVYERNKNYWGRKLNVNVGRYNFDQVRVTIYRDPTVEQEGLKKGDTNFLWVFNSKHWATNIRGRKWDKGWIVKELLKHNNTAGMQGYAFNLRQPIFQNREVRKAIALAMDFEWSNRNLFYGQYAELDSYFDNSELAAEGLPTPEELQLLEPLRAHLPPEVFTTPMGSGKPRRPIRQRLREAKRLLNKNGWRYTNGVLTETKTGRPLRFTVLLAQPGFTRITEPFINNLKRLGIQASMKVVDSSVYVQRERKFDFDMIVGSWGVSQSPGNEQMNNWHSSSAGQEGSQNVIGIRNKAVDELVKTMIGAKTREHLIVATHALDRALWFGHYVVPHWFIGTHRVTYWNKFRRPAVLPKYYSPEQYLFYWWVDPKLEGQLKAAVSAGRTLPRPR